MFTVFQMIPTLRWWIISYKAGLAITQRDYSRFGVEQSVELAINYLRLCIGWWRVQTNLDKTPLPHGILCHPLVEEQAR